MDKVIKMIDDMVALLGKERTDDDDKKEMCEKELDKAEDDLKVTETAISDLEKELEDTKEEVATLTDEIAALQQGIKDLDKQVEEATVNRKEENEDYTADGKQHCSSGAHWYGKESHEQVLQSFY